MYWRIKDSILLQLQILGLCCYLLFSATTRWHQISLYAVQMLLAFPLHCIIAPLHTAMVLDIGLKPFNFIVSHLKVPTILICSYTECKNTFYTLTFKWKRKILVILQFPLCFMYCAQHNDRFWIHTNFSNSGIFRIETNPHYAEWIPPHWTITLYSPSSPSIPSPSPPQ